MSYEIIYYVIVVVVIKQRNLVYLKVKIYDPNTQYSNKKKHAMKLSSKPNQLSTPWVIN